MLFPLESVSHLPDQNISALGQEYLLADDGQVSLVQGAAHHGSGSGSGSGSSSGSGSGSSGSTPAPTTVSSGNLKIDLVWDSSVANAPTGFTADVIAAATYYVTNLGAAKSAGGSVELFIAVGWGEIDGASLASNALGESESYGYTTTYSAVTSALEKDGYSFLAKNEPTTAQFFVTSSQAKELGLISGTSGGTSSSLVDGFVGFSTLGGTTGYNWNFSTSQTTSSQFYFEGVVLHEISEVMGRVEMEGGTVINGKATYTPLDLFNYSAQGVLELSNKGGYFSTNNGETPQGYYNSASLYSGDIADWQSYTGVNASGTTATNVADAYDAFLSPGYNAIVSADDLLEDAALGYALTTAGAALA